MNNNIHPAVRLRLLSVRILNDESVHFGSGFLYIHDEKKAYVLTAAHVVREIESDFVIVECQSDLRDLRPNKEQDYRFRVEQTAIRYASSEQTESEDDDEIDIAVIELNIEDHPRLRQRDKAEFPFRDDIWTIHSVTGFGYPSFKKHKAIEYASVRAKPREAICANHTGHYMEWELGIKVTDPNSDKETHGWSGSVMVLADREPFVMIGFVLSMPDGFMGEETYGLDMYYARRILEKEFGVTVREARPLESVQRNAAPVNSNCGFIPSSQRTQAWIRGSRDTLIEDLKDRVEPNNPLYLCGPAGWGKTELARAIAAKHKLGGKPYTIQYLSDGEGEHMKNSLLAAECNGKQFHGGTKEERDKEFADRLQKLFRCDKQPPLWLIIDDFYHPHLPADKLMKEPSFKSLFDLGNFIICTTRYNLSGKDRCAVPYMFKDEEQHKHKLREQMRGRSNGAEITDVQFDAFFNLTNGNLLLAEWISRTLETGFVGMNDVLDALRTGDFTKASFFPDIPDERTGIEAPLNKHICDLYDIESLDVEERQILALLHFAGAGKDGLPLKLIQLLGRDKMRIVNNLYNFGWCRVENQKNNGEQQTYYYLDPVLRLVCRCRKLTPDANDLKKLLSKMHQYYGTSKDDNYCTMIWEYYTAASAYLDDEARLWYEEICCVQQKKGGEAHG